MPHSYMKKEISLSEMKCYDHLPKLKWYFFMCIILYIYLHRLKRAYTHWDVLKIRKIYAYLIPKLTTALDNLKQGNFTITY